MYGHGGLQPSGQFSGHDSPLPQLLSQVDHSFLGSQEIFCIGTFLHFCYSVSQDFQWGCWLPLFLSPPSVFPVHSLSSSSSLSILLWHNKDSLAYKYMYRHIIQMEAMVVVGTTHVCVCWEPPSPALHQLPCLVSFLTWDRTLWLQWPAISKTYNQYCVRNKIGKLNSMIACDKTTLSRWMVMMLTLEEMQWAVSRRYSHIELWHHSGDIWEDSSHLS